MALLAPGKLNYGPDGSPSIVSAPPETHALFGRLYRTLQQSHLSRDQLEALIELAQARQTGAIEPAQAHAAAAQISTAIGSLFSAKAVAWYSFMIAALTLYLAIVWHTEDQEQQAVLVEEQRHSQAVAEAQLETSREMLATIRNLAISVRERPEQITAPPLGPRSKRQRRRDRRFAGHGGTGK